MEQEPISTKVIKPRLSYQCISCKLYTTTTNDEILKASLCKKCRIKQSTEQSSSSEQPSDATEQVLIEPEKEEIQREEWPKPSIEDPHDTKYEPKYS